MVVVVVEGWLGSETESVGKKQELVKDGQERQGGLRGGPGRAGGCQVDSGLAVRG